MYYPLGIKTDYSLMKSLIKIDDLVSYATKNGINTLGILDDNLSSSHIFYKKCLEHDIKPVIGLDYVYQENHIYLYPSNHDGLVSLFKLTKLDNVDSSVLQKYSDNVICVIPFASSSLYDELKDVYKNVFISYSNEDEKKNSLLITDKVVYINIILSIDINNAKYINYLEFIDKGLKLGDQELKDYTSNVLNMDIKEDTSVLTNLIDIKFPTDERYIPHYDETIKDSKEYLTNLANKGLAKRLNNKVPKEYQERLNYELKVIINMGFVDYFLIVFDYVRFAIKNDIFVGAGRGSAVGSLVAYSLGITSIDPIKYNLLFERFLNPERVTMPDIDIDFDYERKDEVVEYVKDKYGEDKVAKIMTFGTMTAKEVLRVVAKINDIDETQINALVKKIDSKKSLKENESEVSDILKRNSMLRKVYNESYYLEGIKKHIGTHAAGVVVSSEVLTNIIPVIKSGDEYLTGYTMNELEELGLLKMDFLSIKNLTIIANVLNDIRKTKPDFNINQIPLDDADTYKLFASGDTVGIFQFESTGIKNFLKKQRPTCFDDLVMAIAIYRPGPMQSIDTYIERKNHHAKVEYLHEDLKPILESTYGILIYQEQIMEILRKIGAYSYARADIIRRAISKKKLEVIESERDNFVNNAVKNGYEKDMAVSIFDLIVRFADFGFNKSHSVAYAMIAYQMAYLKAHFEYDYYVNLLNTNIGGEVKTKEYIDEAKRSGISILKPDINLSSDAYNRESDGIRLPLRVIKGVGIAASDAILKIRGDKPFADYYDFVARCYGTNVNKKTLECLIYAGVFDAYGYNRATLIKNIPAIITYAELIGDLDSSLVSKPEMEVNVEFNDIELMNKELELFGYYVSSHPASKYPNVMKQVDIASYFDKYIETVVLIEHIKTLKTKNNDDMAFITGSDETTTSDFVIFSRYFDELKKVKEGDLARIFGKVEKRLDKYQIIINKIEKI